MLFVILLASAYLRQGSSCLCTGPSLSLSLSLSLSYLYDNTQGDDFSKRSPIPFQRVPAFLWYLVSYTTYLMLGSGL